MFGGFGIENDFRPDLSGVNTGIIGLGRRMFPAEESEEGSKDLSAEDRCNVRSAFAAIEACREEDDVIAAAAAVAASPNAAAFRAPLFP